MPPIIRILTAGPATVTVLISVIKERGLTVIMPDPRQCKYIRATHIVVY